MPIFNNALTNQPVNRLASPVDQNLGAAFGYYPQLRRNRTVQDPQAAADMPVQFLRGRLAATAGLPSDILNMIRTPTPMEVYGDVDYGAQQQVPYGSQELLKTLPLPPQGAAQEAAANIGAVIPLSPAEALKAARAATQAAMAAGRAGVKTLGPTAAQMAENYLQRQGMMPGILPNSIANKSEVKNLATDFADQIRQMGFDVTLDHSGSKVGASSYLRVSDPQTGRFLSKPIRISDHSKGARELDANINVLNPQEDFAKIISVLNDMRTKGETLVFKQDKYAQELIANGVKPKTAYQRAKIEITEAQLLPAPQQANLEQNEMRKFMRQGR